MSTTAILLRRQILQYVAYNLNLNSLNYKRAVRQDLRIVHYTKVLFLPNMPKFLTDIPIIAIQYPQKYVFRRGFKKIG